MLIDTNDPQVLQAMEEKKEELTEEKLAKGHYDASDIALVRVTDHLPQNGVVPAICNVPFVCKLNDIPHEVFYRMMEEQADIDESDYERATQIRNELIAQAREYSPLSTQYRSSVHCCLNGLVSSHMQGNFEGNPFVIIEPFAPHEHDPNILAVRGEDTYFEEGITLSDQAIILVEESHMDDLLTQQLNPNTRIVTYRGDQKVATEYVLMNLLGVVPELIGKDYPRDSKTTPLLRSFIDEHHYPQDKHCFSDSYRQDDEKNTVLWHRYAEDFYTYLYDKLGDGQDHKKEIAQLINGSWINDNDCAVFKKIVDTMGVEAYHQAVTEYNQEIQAKIDQGIYPTNKAIMNGAPLGIASEKQDTK